VRDRWRGGAGRGRALTAAGALAVAGVLAACSSASSSSSAPAASPSTAAGAAAASMATSVATSAETWAVLPMSADPAFWEVFVRSGNAAPWKLATPPGVADNGGLVVAAGGASSLTVAVRPSQDLLFSPLAATANGGATWSAGPPLDAAVAASPGAFAAYGAKLAALLTDGAVEASADAGATWSVIAKPGAIAASPAGKGCGGAVRVTTVSFGLATIAVASGNVAVASTDVLAGGTCGSSGGTALFSYSPGTGWQRVSLPASGQLVRLAGAMALIQGTSGLSALWRGAGWYAYGSALPSSASASASTPQPAPTNWSAAAALPASGQVIASGTLALDGAWVLLSGGRAAVIGGPGQQWTLLPPVPAKTAVLAAGPDGATDALAVSGTTLTVWRLTPKATVWQQTEAISVPVQAGSSS
jgi:hypothetical protein